MIKFICIFEKPFGISESNISDAEYNRGAYRRLPNKIPYLKGSLQLMNTKCSKCIAFAAAVLSAAYFSGCHKVEETTVTES
ncbi:MAG: hypothetical protein K2G87_08060, partial [Oscillospiraceae bacterium]|nr:hypothetical protein [Oscillospiraceae bacterium]